MSIKEIINTNPNIQLVISAADLKEFALELLAEREKFTIKHISDIINSCFIKVVFID